MIWNLIGSVAASLAAWIVVEVRARCRVRRAQVEL